MADETPAEFKKRYADIDRRLDSGLTEADRAAVKAEIITLFKAVEQADEIYAVPGLSAVFVGPNDLAYSMRSADGTMPSKEAMERTLTRIREAAARQQLPCGLHVLTAADALKRAREGWQFIAVGSELKMMLDGAADAARQINKDDATSELAKY